MLPRKGNRDGNGVNYIGQRLYLEDMHPANVFVDVISDTPICIDCIVKFIWFFVNLGASCSLFHSSHAILSPSII